MGQKLSLTLPLSALHPVAIPSESIQTRDTRAIHIILPLPCGDEKRQNSAA
jgi:hypothetical protein